MRLLSETKGIGDGKVGGRDIAPGSPAEAFANVMKAIFGKDAATAAEALKLQYEVWGTDVQKSLAAQRRLDQIQTEYSKGTAALPKAAYWNNPAEMLARAHEIYVSEMIQRQGGDTRAVAKAHYTTEKPGDVFSTYYPQAAERDHIFQKFTDLHDALRRDDIMGAGATGERPGDLNIVDPRVWDKMVDPKRDPGLFAALRREVQAQKNFRAKLWGRMGFSETAADPGHLGIGTRMADTARALTYSIRGIGDAVTERQPKGAARDAYQHIMDLIAPAEGIRSAEDAIGRHIGPVFEEDVRGHARPNINKTSNILAANGLDWSEQAHTPTQQMIQSRTGAVRDVNTEKAMLRHTMTEGRDDNFVPTGSKTGKAVPIPDNIKAAGASLRFLLDQEWRRNQKAGLDVGYARNGYFPRQYDDHKIYGNETGFKKAATELHRTIFEKDVGDDPAKLLAAHDRMPKDIRDGLAPDVQDGIKDLRANLKQQDRLQSAVDDGTHKDPVAAKAELDQLKTDAAKLHDDLHDPVRGLYAQTAANDWFTRINNGDPADFDTRGPTASYMRGEIAPGSRHDHARLHGQRSDDGAPALLPAVGPQSGLRQPVRR